MTRFHHDIIIPDIYNHQVEEEKIIKFWRKEKIFEKLKQLRREKNDGKFSFYSAPVTPSGHPHSGHILNNLVKDVLKRYGYQKNLRVENRFRWDGHGLPIQYEVDDILRITQPREYEQIDVKYYNDHCRAVAEEHIAEWNRIFERLGICMDSSKQYSTSDNKFMEGVWNVFKKLYDKQLIYRDTKTLPYSTRCFSHLSYFEVNRNLKEVTEIGFTIALSLVDSNEKILVWTTNPLALTMNSELCVNQNEFYVKVKVKDQIYILSRKCLQFVFENPTEYIIIEEVTGKSLEGLQCKPLYENIPLNAGFTICNNAAISHANIGTGVVLLDDFAIEPLREAQILNMKEIKYKKPHCPQTGTLLVSKRVDSWFLRIEDIIDVLTEHISDVNWFPDGMFAPQNLIHWLLVHQSDWSISRRRHWGTPLPIWTSPSGDELICIGSLDELKRLSGCRDIPNLHREVLDKIHIPSKTPGNPPLRRVPDVFDGWFETSVLPFIWKFEQADFVAEGNNHSQGWFYTLLVVSTALSEDPPFRTILAHGLTLERNGLKVQKRKHNQNDPMKLYEKYGADAVRLYLLSQLDEDFTVEEKGVAKLSEELIKPLYRIFYKCTSQMGCPKWVNYGYVTDWTYEERDPLDRWILSRSESILKFYIEEMNCYKLNTFLPRVLEFLKQIEEWYIPLRCPKPIPENVKETYNNTMSIHRSTSILFNVIYRVCLVLAPFAPFITEMIFRVHRKWMVYYRRPESIHGALLIDPDCRIIKPKLVLDVQRMQSVVTVVRQLRIRHMLPIDYKIKEVVVIHHDQDIQEGLISVKDSFKEIINACLIRITDDYQTFGAIMRAELKERFKSRKQAIFEQLNAEELKCLIKRESSSKTDGEEHKSDDKNIKLDEIDISYGIPKEIDASIAMQTIGDFLVVIKMNKHLFFYEEGTIKELVHQICRLKKKNNYYRSECVTIHCWTDDECIKNVITTHIGVVNKNANCDLVMIGESRDGRREIGKGVTERLSVKGAVIEMYLDAKCD